MTSDLSVKRISYDDTKPFIMGIHYARRMPQIQYAFGLFDGKYPWPVGICTYGQPASPWLCKGVAGEQNRKNVLELNRLCLYPEYNGGNYGSFLVSHSLNMLPSGTFVVSYADWGGGITSAMYIRRQTGFIRVLPSREPTSIPSPVTQGTTQAAKQGGKKGRKSIGTFILSEIREQGGVCVKN